MTVKYGRPPRQPRIARNGQNGDRMLRVSQAADMMNAHPNSVRHWADMGLLPAYRIGQRGDRRFRVQDIHKFLRAHGKYQRLVAQA